VPGALARPRLGGDDRDEQAVAVLVLAFGPRQGRKLSCSSAKLVKNPGGFDGPQIEETSGYHGSRM
jgi:hypothetical protein